MRRLSPHPPRQAGFSLVEMAVVLIILGIVLGMGFNAATRMAENEAIEETKLKLSVIEEALIRYVRTNGRLPCPTDASLPDTDSSAPIEEFDGLERRNPDGETCLESGMIGQPIDADNTIRGLPWLELGLPIDFSVDGWGRRFSYHVYHYNSLTGLLEGQLLNRTLSLVRDAGLDMIDCDVSDPPIEPDDIVPTDALDDCAENPESADTPDAPRDYLYGRGLTVQDQYDNILVSNSADYVTVGGGAAFVIISHGNDGNGAFLRSGERTTVPDVLEELQYQNVDNDFTFVAAPINEGDTEADFFDDIVSYMTVSELADRAGRYAGAGGS